MWSTTFIVYLIPNLIEIYFELAYRLFVRAFETLSAKNEQ
jgi:hypothetical protein